MKSFDFSAIKRISSSSPARGTWVEILILTLWSCWIPRCRLPHGGRGLKYFSMLTGEGEKGSSPARGTWVEIVVAIAVALILDGRLPHGGRGLKFGWGNGNGLGGRSSPARGTWVEMSWRTILPGPRRSSPARGTWVEILSSGQAGGRVWSSPARGTWVEINQTMHGQAQAEVVSRTGDVG